MTLAPHGARLQPEPDELGKGNDPVLPSRKRGDRSLQPFGRVDDSGIYMSGIVHSRVMGRMVAPSASRFSTRA